MVSAVSVQLAAARVPAGRRRRPNSTRQLDEEEICFCRAAPSVSHIDPGRFCGNTIRSLDIQMDSYKRTARICFASMLAGYLRRAGARDRAAEIYENHPFK